MLMTTSSVIDERVLASGDEAGTAPDDRRFRPDVEGLRAVAVLLVVLFHAGVPRLTGGYVGVDVFFVISGFVITGLLLRERKGTGRTSILDFYARRVRRILPGATLVILATVAASYLLLGVVSGNNIADDGRWAAIFLSNFHFEAIGTNYLTASRPPSPLQNYWSLSIEEQFYVVYPTLFLLVAGLKGRLTLQVKLAIMLGIVIVLSYWLSIVQTASHPDAAYFSPFARAWELALGALIAVGTPWLKQIPGRVAGLVTWAGLAAIVYAAFAFNSLTAYPGSLVAVPVIGAGLVIAGGVAIPRSGAESLLGLGPFQWLGKRSYSLYLLHWPILVIAAERVGKTNLPLGENLALVGVALLLSMWTYVNVENRIRHWKLPSLQSFALGVGTVAVTIAVLTFFITTDSLPSNRTHVVPAVDNQAVLAQVSAATGITRVSSAIRAEDFGSAPELGIDHASQRCKWQYLESILSICNVGPTTSHKLVVVYGDSHALMWLPAFDAIATQYGIAVKFLIRFGCPANYVSVSAVPGFGQPPGPVTACDTFHAAAVSWINRTHPSLLVITEANIYDVAAPAGAPLTLFSSAAWLHGLSHLFSLMTIPRRSIVFLGSSPYSVNLGPDCLRLHVQDVQACSSPTRSATPLVPADEAAARAAGVKYVNTIPWFCSSVCTPIIGPYEIYDRTGHVLSPWIMYLENVLAQSLGLIPTQSSR